MSILLLWGCSTDPNTQRINYLKKGQGDATDRRYQEAIIEFRNAIRRDPKSAVSHDQLASVYLAVGNKDAAYSELREAVALDAKNVDAQLRLIGLLLERRQYKEAKAAIEKVLAIDPNNAQAHSNLGQVYFAMRDLPHATLELQKAVTLNPQQVNYYSALAAIYLASGKPLEAQGVDNEAIRANPKSVDAHVALGEFYFSQGKLAEAEAEMRIGADLDSRAITPRLRLARIYARTGRRADAEATYIELKKIAPDNPQAYQALALYYLATGRKENAASEFQNLRASRPKDNSVKLYLADTLIDLRRVQEATPLVEDLLKQNPGDPGALMLHGQILIATRKYQEAASELGRAVMADPKSARGYYFLGIAQKALRLGDSAKSSFAHALELRPGMTEADAALTGLSVQNGEADNALRRADHAVNANPAAALGYVARAQALLEKRDLRQGEAMLESALRQDPASLPALAILVKLYSKQGKSKDALQRLSGLAAARPNDAGLQLLMAVCYFDLKDVDKAEASAKRAIAVDPQTSEAYAMLANVDLARGSVEQAKAHLRTAIEINPRNVSNYLALESSYKREGNWEEAKKVVERAHQIDAGSPQVAMELAFLYLEHGGDVNVALSLAQMVKQKIPDFPPAADLLGWAYYKMGSVDSAIPQLEECVRKVPGQSVYQYHLGMAYMAAGRSKPAEQYLRRALEIDPSLAYAPSAKAALDQMSKFTR